MNDFSDEGIKLAASAAHKLSSRFTLLAAGILEGVAQALRDQK